MVWNMNFIFHFIYGMSSFPLTFIFFRMVKTTNQGNMIPHLVLGGLHAILVWTYQVTDRWTYRGGKNLELLRIWAVLFLGRTTPSHVGETKIDQDYSCFTHMMLLKNGDFWCFYPMFDGLYRFIPPINMVILGDSSCLTHLFVLFLKTWEILGALRRFAAMVVARLR